MMQLDSSAEDRPPTKKQKTKPLMPLSRPPPFDLGSLSQSASQPKGTKGQGKEKQTVPLVSLDDSSQDSLWVDKYEPVGEEDLAVHKRKIQDVKQWLLEAYEGGPSGKLRKYRRILVLTGPAGTAKTATIRVLSKELGCEILEWRNSMDEHFARDPDSTIAGWSGVEYEGLSEKFQAFLTRASSCRPLFSCRPHTQTSPLQSSQKSSSSSASVTGFSTSTSPSTCPSKRQLILLEDLPNILHPPTQVEFHAALEAFVASPEGGVAPLVIIISDAGLRGEGAEDEGGSRWKSRGKEVVDVRNVLPASLLRSPYVTQISFNPIASTYMRSALKTLLDRHVATSSSSTATRPTKDVLDVIVDSSNGDIRSAIMALQFACIAGTNSTQKAIKGAKRGKAQGPSARVMLEAVTRREQSLALFHLLGKVMYNKRKGDPPSSSASAKDIRKDQEMDDKLKDPRPLPPHLKHHERRASRVDVDSLYADSPVDASLLSLYIHQNYTQYCSTIDECDALMDSLSWWYQANPHQFHMVVLGTMHALPSPVPRRSQKPYKPAFFEALRNQGEAEDGIHDVQLWLQQRSGVAVPGWSHRDVALGVGTVLCARDRFFTSDSPLRPPSTHRLFSTLEFSHDGVGVAELAEEGDVALDAPEIEREHRPFKVKTPTVDTGAWLSDDDIEEW
ncbi:hypothetical protein BN946_scf185016.g67 [Trametes cinnabarina]|uniref:AAA+ ATPase domain-containing protein n=1 Tax=Pycnoporus cinnabarinus TaxID=5643 RepID=A0A060SHP5_PYCCI|nr:hypothetical protein BN946_scf185016.g67 [Trametes cinnabarina]